MIGAGLAEAAVKRGDEVAVWNRSPDKAKALEKVGARAAASAEEAIAGAARVHVALSDDAAVDAVLAACGAKLASAVVIDHTTTSPAGTVARAARLLEAGVAFLHAPVFMSPAMCRDAKGIMLAAGPKAVFDRVSGELAKMTGSLDYRGERPDVAAAYKLFGNSMIITITAGLADVFALASSLDIPASDAHALFSKFNPANVLTYRGASMARGDYAASFELTMARKDVRLMIETAERGDEPLAVLPAIAARMDELIARGHGADDLGVMSVDAVPKKS